MSDPSIGCAGGDNHAARCSTCGGRGQIQQCERVDESDFREWEIDCPVCDGAGQVPKPLQDYIAALQAKVVSLQREAYDWWSAAAAKPTPPEGWQLVLVNEGFRPLMDALDRAHRKGYMPDAITADYEGFNWEQR